MLSGAPLCNMRVRMALIQYGAVFLLTYDAFCDTCSYYEEILPKSGSKDIAILDMCSSWVSHYPSGYKAGRIAGRSLHHHSHPSPKFPSLDQASYLHPAR